MNRFVFFSTLFFTPFANSLDVEVPVKSQDTLRKELKAYLFKNASRPYNKNTRPTKNPNLPTKIGLNLGLKHIEKVDERRQILVAHGWLSMTWTDTRLTWNMLDFGGISSIKVRYYDLWRPEISIYNIASGSSERSLNYWRNEPALHHIGYIYTWMPLTMSVSCKFDFTNYPFDEQECPIVIGDWVQPCSDVEFVDFLNESVVRSYMAGFAMGEKMHASGWEIVQTRRKHKFLGTAGMKDEVPEGDDKEYYWSFGEYWVRIRRHRPYYGVTDVMPGIVTCFLTLTAFFVDSEPMVLVILLGSLTTQSVFDFDLLKSLPENSGGIPKIVKLYGANFALSGIALILHIFIFYAKDRWPSISLPAYIQSFGKKMYGYRAFQAKNLQFDPQTYFEEENHREEALIGDDSLKLTNQEPEEEMAGKTCAEMTFSDYVGVGRKLMFLIFVLIYCIVIITTLFG